MDDEVDIIIINLFVGSLTKNGNRRQAKRLFLETLELIRRAIFLQQTNNKETILKDPFIFILEIILNLKPLVVLESKRVGGVIYRLPRLISSPRRGYSIAVHWLIKSAMMRKERGFALKLANEILDTARGKSSSLKKRNELYDLAINNRPFVRYLK